MSATDLRKRYGYCLEWCLLQVCERLERRDCTQAQIRAVLPHAWAKQIIGAVRQAQLADHAFSTV